MTALLSIKDYVYGTIIVLLIAGGAWYHHHVLEEGVADQVAKDNVAMAALQKITAQQTATLQAKATMAEQTYDKERADDKSYADTHPVQPVRLCNANNSASLVPKAGSAQRGDAGTGAGTPSVQPVPAGNNSGGQATAGPDIEPMLNALGVAADNVSAVLREYQTR